MAKKPLGAASLGVAFTGSGQGSVIGVLQAHSEVIVDDQSAHVAGHAPPVLVVRWLSSLTPQRELTVPAGRYGSVVPRLLKVNG